MVSYDSTTKNRFIEMVSTISTGPGGSLTISSDMSELLQCDKLKKNTIPILNSLCRNVLAENVECDTEGAEDSLLGIEPHIYLLSNDPFFRQPLPVSSRRSANQVVCNASGPVSASVCGKCVSKTTTEVRANLPVTYFWIPRDITGSTIFAPLHSSAQKDAAAVGTWKDLAETTECGEITISEHVGDMCTDFPGVFLHRVDFYWRSAPRRTKKPEMCVTYIHSTNKMCCLDHKSLSLCAHPITNILSTTAATAAPPVLPPPPPPHARSPLSAQNSDTMNITPSSVAEDIRATIAKLEDRVRILESITPASNVVKALQTTIQTIASLANLLAATDDKQ